MCGGHEKFKIPFVVRDGQTKKLADSPFAKDEICLARDNFVDSRDSNRLQYGTVSRLYKIAVRDFRFFLPVRLPDLRTDSEIWRWQSQGVPYR